MILRTVDLVKHFGSLRAVDSVSLEIEEGETRAIIGPNGAGKSTLLDVITNRSRASSGRTYFRDREISNLPPFTIASSGIGRCFQISKLFFGLSVYENVEIACLSKWRKVYSVRQPEDSGLRSEVASTLHSIGLTKMAHELAGYLSYGDQRRLEIGITLAMSPALLLLDEPTAGVSRGEGHDLMRLIKSLAAEKALTIVFIEHDMDMVFGYSDKISVMHLGRLVMTGTPEEVRRDELVQRIYLGEKAS